MNNTPNKTGYIGITDKLNGRFAASVWVKGEHIHVGMFSDPLQAAVARTKHIKKHKLKNRFDGV